MISWGTDKINRIKFIILLMLTVITLSSCNQGSISVTNEPLNDNAAVSVAESLQIPNPDMSNEKGNPEKIISRIKLRQDRNIRTHGRFDEAFAPRFDLQKEGVIPGTDGCRYRHRAAAEFGRAIVTALVITHYDALVVPA